jgi:hypothetical protein
MISCLTVLLFRSQLAAPSTLTLYFLAVVAVVEVVDLMKWTVGRSVIDLQKQLSSTSQG